MNMIHFSQVEAARKLIDSLEKYNGAISCGEKAGQPILFNTYKAKDVGLVRVANEKRMAELGFCAGMEADLWGNYRERHTRRDYIIGQDEQDYNRQLIDAYDDVREGDYAMLADGCHKTQQHGTVVDVEIHDDDEPWIDQDNECKVSDDELRASFNGAQEAHIATIRKHIDEAHTAGYSVMRNGKTTWIANPRVATPINGYTYRCNDRVDDLRHEFDLVYRGSGISSNPNHDHPETWADSIVEAFERKQKKVWREYGALKRAMQVTRQQHTEAVASGHGRTAHNLEGNLLGYDIEMTTLRNEAMRIDTILNAIENTRMEISRGGIEDQTFELGMLARESLDKFATQFADHFGGLDEITGEESPAKKYEHTALTDEQCAIYQHMGYGVDDLVDEM